MKLNNALEEIGLRFGADGELEYANQHEDDAVSEAAYPVLRLHVSPSKFGKLLDQAMMKMAAHIAVGVEKNCADEIAEMVVNKMKKIEREVEDAIRREMTKQITLLIKERLAKVQIFLSVKGEVEA